MTQKRNELNFVRRMLTLPLGLALQVLAAVILCGLNGYAQSVPELPQKNGAGDTPDISIKLIQSANGGSLKPGETLQLSSLDGRVVLLDVFSSKCPHCIDHAPHVAELYNLYRTKGLTVLGLATDQPDRAEDVKSFIGTARIAYPVGFLTAEVIVYFLDRRNHGVPQMVLFGRDGKMVKRIIGWRPEDEKELRAAIDAELAKPATTRPAR
ncbi:MAG: TlpA family protein disulfide reductase [Acidobacteriota bacterium]|jgi:thiol-disulfide isomerase/thioredoxin